MKCEKCKGDFPESEIQDSHDVPFYLFWDRKKNRRERKHFADLYRRRYLCKPCHESYELSLLIHLKKYAKDFGKKYFGGGDDTEAT